MFWTKRHKSNININININEINMGTDDKSKNGEVEAIQTLCAANEVQLVNYLNALHIDNGLLINFGGETLECKRKYRVYKCPFK
ncbi:MAG: hypothetical protein IKZ61_03825 [Prevotella sp.]|nr:hypothetical protein [Prevotella sp.]